MNTNNTESIGIFFSKINDKDKKIFERVIAFNNSHGLKIHYCTEPTSSNIIITHENDLPQLEQDNSSVLLVISNDKSLGNIQVAPPLLITRVMKAIENAIKLIGQDNRTETQEMGETEKATSSEEYTPKRQYHALVIDDSTSIRKQVELELRDAGVSTDFAESGEQALEKIKTAQYDLIFLDIIMPGIDGYETCKKMRESVEYKKTPIIMLSGKSTPLDEVAGVIAGATCYLTKPVKSAMLQQTLNRVTKWIDNFADLQKEKAKA